MLTHLKSALKSVAAAAVLAAAPAVAQDWPTKEVTFIVPSGAGGTQTAMMNVLKPFLEEKWGQPVIIENRPGAGGLIGVREVMRATPDGYTMVFAFDSITTYKLLLKDNEIDPANDMEPVALTVNGNFVMYGSADTGAKNINEFVEYAKAHPGELNFGAIGRVSQYIDTYRFMEATGIEMEAVMFESAPDLQLALSRGEIDFVVTSVNTGKPVVDSGAAVALASTGSRRIAEFPDVPTLTESGIDLDLPFWYGIFAPGGTPAPVVEKVSADVAEVLKDPTVIEAFAKMGSPIAYLPPAEFKAFVTKAQEARAAAVESAGIEKK